MRLFTGIVFCSLVMGVTSENWFSFFKEALQGAGDLGRAYWNVLTSSHQNSKRYFYAQGNYDAAERGPGGVWAAKLISSTRVYLQGFLDYYLFGNSSTVLEDSKSNEKAEEWGRSGKDPDRFRPDGMPKND
ncbi:serum amyloid A4, constitutive precursor [Macaca nemestrina]|uniref:Serum amyloid A protein n=2 Tax=Macaca TaxID=9539 RepID=A0A2K6DYZ0_MACNE|nr:serum amyloid A4, constitutive precursor [Macaca nemestrina]XP_050611446.1 serum amyloid A-4 protein isoform X2 [Macaca thibetana thibetana]